MPKPRAKGTALEAVTLDGVSHLDARIYPFIGYALKGIIVTPYLQRRTEGEAVDVVTESALKSDNSSLAFGVNPIPWWKKYECKMKYSPEPS